jgi:hypothetical protein
MLDRFANSFGGGAHLESGSNAEEFNLIFIKDQSGFYIFKDHSKIASALQSYTVRNGRITGSQLLSILHSDFSQSSDHSVGPKINALCSIGMHLISGFEILARVSDKLTIRWMIDSFDAEDDF